MVYTESTRNPDTNSTYTTSSDFGCCRTTCLNATQTVWYSFPSIPKENQKPKFDREDHIESTKKGWIDLTHFEISLYSPEPQFHRQLLFSLSGWLAPPGKLKRCGKYEGRN